MKAGQPRVIVAIDPHKRINAVDVVDDRAEVIAREVFPNTAEGYRQLLCFARQWRQRRWAVEGCGGRPGIWTMPASAQYETVVDVSSRRSSLVRAFATTSGRKTDDIDAYSVALAALHTPGLQQVTVDGHHATLRLLAHRRKKAVAMRTQAVCRLHRELLVMLPGGAPKRLSATRAKALLAAVRPRDEVGRVRSTSHWTQLADLVRIDARIKDINSQLREAVKATSTGLPELYGVGTVTTALVLGEVKEHRPVQKNRHHFRQLQRQRTGPSRQRRRSTGVREPVRQPSAQTTHCTSLLWPNYASPTAKAVSTSGASAPKANRSRKPSVV